MMVEWPGSLSGATLYLIWEIFSFQQGWALEEHLSRFDFLTLWIMDVGAGTGERKVTKTSAAWERQDDTEDQKWQGSRVPGRHVLEMELSLLQCQWERIAQNGLSNGESHGTLLRWKCHKRGNYPDWNSVFKVTLQITLYNLGTYTISMLGKVSLILFRPCHNCFLLVLWIPQPMYSNKCFHPWNLHFGIIAW